MALNSDNVHRWLKTLPAQSEIHIIPSLQNELRQNLMIKLNL